MKISPLEIRQKTFEKNFRGYDKDEVDAFLQSLSQEWERVMDESKELKLRLSVAEREVQKLREVESTLYKTLKTAEDTGANIVEQANKSAELLLKESQINAESMLGDARTKAKNMVEEAEEKAKNVLFKAQNKLSEIVLEIKTLESQRQNLVHDLRQFAQTVLDKANHISAAQAVEEVRSLAEDLNFVSNAAKQEDIPKDPEPAQTIELDITHRKQDKPIEVALPIDKPQEEPKHKISPATLSFFDQLV